MTRLEEIRERAEKATAGPWKYNDNVYCADRGICWDGDLEYDHIIKYEDGDFISHAREDIPYLLDRLEKAEAVLREIESGAIYVDGKPGKTPKTRARAYFEEVTRQTLPSQAPDQ